MKIDWSTLLLQTVNVLVLVWLLGRFLFRPVARIIADRQAQAVSMLHDAEAAKLAAQKEQAAMTDERAELAAHRADAMAQASDDASKQRAALVAAAQEEAARLREQAAAEIGQERLAHDEAASVRAVHLAVYIAQKLLERVPDALRVMPFVDGLADGVRKLSPAARDDMSDGAALQLIVPRALTGDEQAACEAALASVLGRPIPLCTQIEPALIAGLELAGTHAVVRNSWRDQLEQVRSGLQGDDGHT
jgi:F-type H+-transporting ATPase subunit b